MSWEDLAFVPQTILYGAAVTIVVWGICHLYIAFVSFFSDYFNNVLIVQPHLHGVYYAVSYWTEKGGRPYQEDRYAMMKVDTRIVLCMHYSMDTGALKHHNIQRSFTKLHTVRRQF